MAQNSVDSAIANGTISAATVNQRAQDWVNHNYAYNQSDYKNAPFDPVGPYRVDCSGFISMAWGLSYSANTQGLAGIDPNQPVFTHQIAKDDLQLGDIIVYNSTITPGNGSHAVMFVRWANAQHTAYVEDEEESADGAVQRTISYPYDVPMDGSGSWIPYRYNNITGGGGLTHTTPAVAAEADNDQQSIFWDDTNAQIHEAESNGLLWNVYPKGWPTSSSPSVSVNNNGDRWVFWSTGDGVVHEEFWNSTNGWIPESMDSWPHTNGTPAVAVQPTSSSQWVFYRGMDNQIHESWWNQTAGWQTHNQGWATGSAPSAAVDNNGSQYVFWSDSSGVIHEAHWTTAGWSLYQFPGWGTAVGTPSVAINPTNDDQFVFWTGPDNKIHEAFHPHASSSWNFNNSLGYTAYSSPSVSVDNAGNQFVFWSDVNGYVNEAWWNPANGTSTGWMSKSFNPWKAM